MKVHDHLSTAKAILALIVFGFAVVLFIKFYENQVYFFEDLGALRNYVVASIVGMGFLITLLFLASKTTHTKVSKVTRKKKK